MLIQSGLMSSKGSIRHHKRGSRITHISRITIATSRIPNITYHPLLSHITHHIYFCVSLKEQDGSWSVLKHIIPTYQYHYIMHPPMKRPGNTLVYGGALYRRNTHLHAGLYTKHHQNHRRRIFKDSDLASESCT